MQGREARRARAVAVYDFRAGTDTRSYEYFGVHRIGERRYHFRLYAPHARSVSLCGDLMAGEALPMRAMGDGIWEADIRADIPLEGMCYGFLLNGESFADDPYARRGFYGERKGSVICTGSAHVWRDAAWMMARWERARIDRPQNFYEVHLGSFATRGGRSNTAGDAYLNYRELGDLLARYASDMGYTHIRLMPLTEHRSDASHGYVADGYFAPTSRHGAPDDLRAMVDRLHREGLGVVMDLSVAVNGALGEMFRVSCPETQSFLLSAVFFWLREFHLDGLCLVGMRRWAEEGREEYEAACRFLSFLCAAVHAEFPDVMLIAGEDIGEMTGERSLGFDLVCHSRFAEDILRYLHAEPLRREFLRDLPMRSVSGAWGESYLLPFSHEAVCAGHSSLFGQMNGSYLQKFRGVRLALAFQMIHPGKKMLFMGCELGQSRTWDDTVPSDWFLADLETHASLIRYVRALNSFYREERCLWQDEREQRGLSAVEAVAERSACLLAFLRTDAAGRTLLGLFNASAEDLSCQCAVGDGAVCYREVFNSDCAVFGGGERVAAGAVIPVESGMLTLSVPAMTAVFLRADNED